MLTAHIQYDFYLVTVSSKYLLGNIQLIIDSYLKQITFLHIYAHIEQINV